MEKDDEVKGSGNSMDFGARIYDSRLGRWLSIDPMAAKYPSYTPYSFVNNMPVIAVDPTGMYIYFVARGLNGEKPEVAVANAKMIINYLNSTEKGRALLQQYIDNPETDLYLTIDDIPSGDLGQTGSFVDQDGNNSVPTVDIGGNHWTTGMGTSLDEFEGLIVNPDANNKFITINGTADELGTQELSPADVPYNKKYAKVLGHEIGAHVPEGGTETEDHDRWGQDHYSHSTSVGTGEAAVLNTQINKLSPSKVTKGAQLNEVKQQGVYKVTIEQE